MASAEGVGKGLSALSGAAADLFSIGSKKTEAAYYLRAAGVYRRASGRYRDAAGLSRENAAITERSTQIKLLGAERALYLTIGGQKADVASAGFKASGTALDLLADSARQGELTKSLLEEQGRLDKNTFEQQATAYDIQAENSLLQADNAQTQADLANDAAAAAPWMAAIKIAAAIPYFL